MRAWFWTLWLAVIAVAVAVLLHAHPGNVLLLVWPYRIELSLALAVLALVTLFVVVYIGLRALVWLWVIPERFRTWRGRRAQARDHELLEQGWISFLEGRYTHAEKNLTKLLAQTKVRPRQVLAALSAARAAHTLGEFIRRDHMLARAREAADKDANLCEAVATVTADLLLDQGRFQQALTVLAPFRERGGRHLHIQHLLLRAEQGVGHDEQVFFLVRGLLRRSEGPRAELLQKLETSAAARLRTTLEDDRWRAIWKDLKTEERLLPEVALAGAAAFEKVGEFDEAARVLEAAMAARFELRLLLTYARTDVSQVPRRLECLERWLQQRPSDPDILMALGTLCLTGQLWGQAERYLLRSVERRPEVRPHALLGSLYDRLDRQAEAIHHWRLATAATIALPVLDRDTALPAAEVYADPSRFGAENEFLTQQAAVPTVKPEDTTPSFIPPTASSAPFSPHDSSNLEEYFDSAPLPVANLDETPVNDPLLKALSPTETEAPEMLVPPNLSAASEIPDNTAASAKRPGSPSSSISVSTKQSNLPSSNTKKRKNQ